MRYTNLQPTAFLPAGRGTSTQVPFSLMEEISASIALFQLLADGPVMASLKQVGVWSAATHALSSGFTIQ